MVTMYKIKLHTEKCPVLAGIYKPFMEKIISEDVFNSDKGICYTCPIEDRVYFLLFKKDKNNPYDYYYQEIQDKDIAVLNI